MAISYVKQVHQSTPTSATTFNLAVTNSPSAGNLIILHGRGGGGSIITGVTDTKGNSWNIDVAGTGSNATINIASCLLTSTLTTSDTISVTYNAAAGSRTMAVYEFSGIDLISKLDVVSSVVTGSGTTATTTATSALNRNNSLVFSAVATNSSNTGTSIFTPSSGYTAINTSLTTAYSGAAYQISTDQTGKSIRWDWGNPGTYAAAVAVYKPQLPNNLLLLGVG